MQAMNLFPLKYLILCSQLRLCKIAQSDYWRVLPIFSRCLNPFEGPHFSNERVPFSDSRINQSD